MLEWLWPWVFVAAPLPLIVHRLSRGESLQPSALRAPFASRWRGLSGVGPKRSIRARLLVAAVAHLDDVDRRHCATTVDWRTH